MTEETMRVKTVSKTSRMGLYTLSHAPTWDVILGQTVEIRPETAEFTDKSHAKVRVKAMVLTGPRTGTEITPLSSMLILSPEQEATIRRYARGNAAAAQATKPTTAAQRSRMTTTPGMI